MDQPASPLPPPDLPFYRTSHSRSSGSINGNELFLICEWLLGIEIIDTSCHGRLHLLPIMRRREMGWGSQMEEMEEEMEEVDEVEEVDVEEYVRDLLLLVRLGVEGVEEYDEE